MPSNQFIIEDMQRFIKNKKITRFAVLKFFISHPGFRITYLHRKKHYHLVNNNKGRYWFWRFINFFSTHAIFIDDGANIGPGLLIAHGYGISLGKVNIGKNCTIFQNVTIGANYKIDDKGNNCPFLGDNVILSPGSVILGPVHIGSSVLVAANAVVTKNVPDNCVVGGVPAAKIKVNPSAERFFNSIL